MRHDLILAADDDHHHHQEHVDEHLHAQQAKLPAAGILRIVLQRSIDRDSLVQFGRNDDRDHQHEQDHQADGYDTLGHQQRLERHAQQVLNNPASGEDDNGGQG